MDQGKLFCPHCGVPMRQIAHGMSVCDRCGMAISPSGKRATKQQQYTMIFVCLAVLTLLVLLAFALK